MGPNPKRGVAIYIRDKFKAQAHYFLHNDFEEAIWCVVHLDRGEKLLVGVMYRSPNSSVNNYRPVSLTSTIGKLLETLVRNASQDHLVCNKLMCDEQHGFRSGRSCCTQLLEVINDWSQAIDDGVDTVYLDYCKAFDSAPHLSLLSKLESYGIKGSLLR